MKPYQELDRLIAEQSSQWIENLEHGDAQARRAFSDWLKDSSRHVKGFLLMTALDEEIKHLDPDRRYPMRRLQESQVAELASPGQAKAKAARVRRKLAPWTWAVAAGIAVLLVTWQLSNIDPGPRNDYRTILGEQRVFELPDGSILHLNTQSHVKVSFSNTAREIRLLAGEALFKVQQDPARPFRVHTSDATIQAIGTQFNVYRRAAGTLVSVIEGRVSVSSDRAADASGTLSATALSAGEEAQVLGNGIIEHQKSSEKNQIAAWRQRQLVFKQSPLREVVAEFNRYNRSSQFRVEGELVAQRLYSGVFDADDPQSLIQLLEKESDIALEKRGGEVVIYGR